jgi:hypothetical protein
MATTTLPRTQVGAPAPAPLLVYGDGPLTRAATVDVVVPVFDE